MQMQFLAACALHEVVVTGFDFGVGRRVVLHEIFDQRAQHHGLLRDGDLRLHVRMRRDSAARGFLHQDFTVDQFFANGHLQLRRVLLALMDKLLDQRIGACFRNRRAVHDGDVLCERRRGRERSQQYPGTGFLQGHRKVS